MPRRGRLQIILLVLCLAAEFAKSADNPPLPLVAANDNRKSAGRLKDGVLNLQLDLCQGRWYPEDQASGYRDVYAFAEHGQPPQISGPLIRVPQGTRIHAIIRNTLPAPAAIFGLHRHPGDPGDAIRLQPGEMREIEFLAGEPGAYLYWAATSGSRLDRRYGPETQLSGAFVVDSPNSASPDRIFVISIWTKNLDSGPRQQIPAINGKSWPYTERLTYKLGEPVHWRVIDGSFDPHAMHLHGFYFTMTAAGDGERYERIAGDRQQKRVTQSIEPGHAFEMTWIPERSGNWLFHCHMLLHMSRLDELHPQETQPAENPSQQTQPKPASTAAYSPVHDPSAGMGGLVIGITVLPAAGSETPASPAGPSHKLQLAISENPDKIPSYKLDVLDPRAPAAPGKANPPSLLGPPIVLTRGEPAEIEVRNLTSVPTAIHWHGIELESFYDGVAGWTGSAQRTTPPILPGTAFVARMTPPRAGTFIYHTHWHDQGQLLNAIYGPLLVLEPGEKYDPEHDRTFVFGTGRYAPFGLMLLINGSPQPDPVALHTATRYRLRFVNITEAEADLRVRLVSKEVPVEWKVLARDGADFPPAQLTSSAADLAIPVGSTCDVEYQSDREGYLEMQVSARLFEGLIMQPFDIAAVK